jgi:toxin YoeB
MKFVFVEESWEDYLYWQKTDKKKLKRINELLKDISRNPFEGIGKPEPLKHKYAGFWSRRIDEEHRLIYKVKGVELLIAKCRFHFRRAKGPLKLPNHSWLFFSLKIKPHPKQHRIPFYIQISSYGS